MVTIPTHPPTAPPRAGLTAAATSGSLAGLVAGLLFAVWGVLVQKLLRPPDHLSCGRSQASCIRHPHPLALLCTC